MKLLVVIVNYTTADLTVACLESLAREIDSVAGGARVVVTDNASGDASVEAIRSAIDGHGWGSWATLVPLEKNGGFAWGNNRGIEPFLRTAGDGDKPQYVYLLNPDTVVLPGALKELIDFLDAHPQVGIAGGRAVQPDGAVLVSAFRFPSPASEFEASIRLGPVTRLLRARAVPVVPVPEEPVPVGWVAGASMMVRREVLEKIGLLDERYFMYYEEVDFCLRAARAGWPTWYVPASRIVHLVGQASGVTGEGRKLKRRPRYWFESRHRYFRQNFGAVPALAADMMFVAGLAVYGLMRLLRCKPPVDPPWLLWDFIRYNLTTWCNRA
jgi:GT2 family glycosyltransferase